MGGDLLPSGGGHVRAGNPDAKYTQGHPWGEDVGTGEGGVTQGLIIKASPSEGQSPDWEDVRFGLIKEGSYGFRCIYQALPGGRDRVKVSGEEEVGVVSIHHEPDWGQAQQYARDLRAQAHAEGFQ